MLASPNQSTLDLYSLLIPPDYKSTCKSYHSGHYNSLGQGPSNSGCSSQFASSPGSYPGTKTENYNIRGCGQQQYNSAISIGSDATRSQISSVTTNFARPPWNFEQESSIDSGLSVTSSSSFDSEFANDPAYLSQGFYNSLRDATSTSQTCITHRSLPTPTQPAAYSGPPAHIYTAGEPNSSLKENTLLMGNTSACQGHYMAPQQQRASTSTSYLTSWLRRKGSTVQVNVLWSTNYVVLGGRGPWRMFIYRQWDLGREN